VCRLLVGGVPGPGGGGRGGLRSQISLPSRVFSEVPFWNSAEYGILYGIDFISRNSAKFFTVQYRGIPRNSE
jgi:hypothetical protein